MSPVPDLCEDMACLYIVRPNDCTGKCPHFDDRMKTVGSIYMILPDDSATFVGRLPRLVPRSPANSPNRAANNVESAPEYPPSPPLNRPLEQA